MRVSATNPELAPMKVVNMRRSVDTDRYGKSRLRIFEPVPTRHIKPSLTGAPILINLTR
jgi:hypothetical protein